MLKGGKPQQGMAQENSKESTETHCSLCNTCRQQEGAERAALMCPRLVPAVTFFSTTTVRSPAPHGKAFNTYALVAPPVSLHLPLLLCAHGCRCGEDAELTPEIAGRLQRLQQCTGCRAQCRSNGHRWPCVCTVPENVWLLLVADQEAAHLRSHKDFFVNHVKVAISMEPLLSVKRFVGTKPLVDSLPSSAPAVTMQRSHESVISNGAAAATA